MGGLDTWTPEQAEKAKAELRLNASEQDEFIALCAAAQSDVGLRDDQKKRYYELDNKLKKLAVIEQWFPDE